MNRQLILESAASLSGKKGYHAASMQDIAEVVNLQKASLYHHFSSKQEILLALLDQALDLLIDRISAVLALDLPVEEKLSQATRSYLECLDEHAALASVLLLEHRSLDPEYHDRHIHVRDRFERLWHNMIRRAVEVSAFADTAIACPVGSNELDHYIVRPDGHYSSGDISDQFVALFLDGLRGR